LLMADEIHDLRVELEPVRATARQPRREGYAAGAGANDAELTEQLTRLAARAEQIAAGLEHP